MLLAYSLKDLPRAGWVRRGVEAPESVAAHSWGLSFLVLNTLPKELNLERALQYAVLHDLGESIVGDFTPADQISSSEKRALETDAMKQICQGLARGDALLSMWEDYEDQIDPEARFVRELDRLDMAIQAAWYAKTTALSFQEFLLSAQVAITHPVLVPLMAAVSQHHQALKDGSSRPS